MQVDDDGSPFSEALDKIYEASRKDDGSPSLQKCVLRLPFGNGQGLVDQQGRLAGAHVDELFDLSFLNVLRGGKDDFLPQELFVRQEVQDMLFALAAPHAEALQGRILTGSPGIGKSVVFFLAAVQRAATLEKKVLYLRKVEEQKAISIFIMEKSPRCGTGDLVNVVFGQDLSTRRIPNLSQEVNTIIDASKLKDEDFYIMLDGPKHNASEQDLLYNGYDALCTSAGYPAPKQAAILLEKTLVLSGWTEDKLKEAMNKLRIQQIDKKYELTGGQIRLVFCPDAVIKDWFDSIINAIGPVAVHLAVTS